MSSTARLYSAYTHDTAQHPGCYISAKNQAKKLDLFNQLLIPIGIVPKATRQIELTPIILLLVGANKGVSMLPYWILQSARFTELLGHKYQTKSVIKRKLFATVKKRESEKRYIKKFLLLSKGVFSRLAQPRQTIMTPLVLSIAHRAVFTHNRHGQKRKNNRDSCQAK